MVGLPLGWKADYDGRRWFYTYRATGHAQYSFPNEGDEFPHFVDASAPAPDLAPEERLESEQQVRRQSEGGVGFGVGTKPRGLGLEPSRLPRMSTTPVPPAGNPWKPDLDPTPELHVEVSPPPPPVFDPVGILAEMPTNDTPASRFEMHPEPAELADNSVLAPIEKEAAARQQPPQWSSTEDGPPPSYQPYIPKPDGTYLRPDKRLSQGAVLQRDVSLMMSLKLPGNLEPSAVPRVLSPPQMPPKVTLQPDDPRRDGPPVRDALTPAPAPAAPKTERATLKKLTRSTAPTNAHAPYLHRHGRTQSQGALSKFPSVLKPARGRIAATPAQLQSLSAQKRSSAPSPASWKTTWEATPPPRVTAPPAYVPYQKGPDDQAAPRPQTASQAEEPSRKAGSGEADSSQWQSAPSTPPPPPAQGPGTLQQHPSAGTMSPEQGRLLTSPRSTRDVSPVQSTIGSLSSRNPIRTPSPVGSSLRSSSNASLLQGPNGATYVPSSMHHSGSAPQTATQDRPQGNRGPAVPDKIPLEHNDASCLPDQVLALGRGGQPEDSSLPVPSRYSSDDYPLSFQITPSPAQRHTAPSSSQKGVLGGPKSSTQMLLPTAQDSALSVLNYKLGRIDEDGERGAAAEPKIVPQNAVPISVASCTQPSPPARVFSLQAQTYSVTAGAPVQEDASQRIPRLSSSPPREARSDKSSTRMPSDSTTSSRVMPSIRLIQSREAAQTAPGSFGQPLTSHPVGKTPVLTVEPLQDFPTPIPVSASGKLAGTDKEKKWTKWFKSSRLSRSQKEQAQCGTMLDAGNMNQLPIRAADGQIV